LPRYQDLLTQVGWLVQKDIDLHRLVARGYSGISTVSHRWNQMGCPDPRGEQMEVVRDYVLDHPEVELIWYDFCCLPQLPGRTPEQDRYFRKILNHIAFLFLCLDVLVIFDTSYVSRFWCCFELWLSMQKATKDGIIHAPDSELRLDFRCVGAAKEAAKNFETAMFDTWHQRAPQEAAEILAKDDIQVTNRRDKDEQLKTLMQLDKRTMKIHNFFHDRHEGAYWAWL